MAEHDAVRIIPHSPEGIPDTGSFEVAWPGGKKYFYWDDNAGRRAISKSANISRAEALEAARALARTERGKLKSGT
jgi:hypothetical protein